MKKLIFIFYGFFLFTLTAFTQPGTPGLDKKQNAQKMAIVKGARTGDLTHKEIKKLKKQQKRLHRLERRAKADGVVTRRERRGLHHASNHTAKNIRKERKDGNRF